MTIPAWTGGLTDSAARASECRHQECEDAGRCLDPDLCEVHCHASKDGECDWKHCPQLRDGEPARSGRHCPRDRHEDQPGYYV